MLVEILTALAVGACSAETDGLPLIAIIIDDLGNQPYHDEAAREIPQLRSFAVLPFTPHARTLAESLHLEDREVLLHLPMEAHAHNELLGPGALLSSMNKAEFVAAARSAIAAVPNVRGVNNHMGSLLTTDPIRMQWLMSVLSDAGPLMFLDSRTTARTVARGAARQAGVPYLERDVFLDNQKDYRAINRQFDELLSRAARRGEAIGIAHPHETTVAVLRMRLAALDRARLVTLKALARQRRCRMMSAGDQVRLRAANSAMQPGLRKTHRGPTPIH